MKGLLGYLKGFLIVLIGILWFELVGRSFELMNHNNINSFYLGSSLLILITMGPIIYFRRNFKLFFNNMKGVFWDDEKKNKK
jgi:hypothetical protein